MTSSSNTYQDQPGDVADLIESVAARGDQQAFGALFDRLSPPALALARRILGSNAEADDVVQEAFLSLWKNAARFDAARGSVLTWLLTFVRNRSIDRLRRRKNVVSMDGHRDDDSVFPEPEDGAPSVEEAAHRNETRRRITAVLAALPLEQRRVLEAAFYEGMTQQEIAKQFQQPLGTIKTRMRLGLLKVAAALKEEHRAP